MSADLKPMLYHPAEPIHRVVPQFPAQLQAMITKSGTIDVRVAIDKTGRVTKAEVNPNSGFHQLVLERLLSASRLWKFKPARRGDEPVSSEFVIQFNFRR